MRLGFDFVDSSLELAFEDTDTQPFLPYSTFDVLEVPVQSIDSTVCY
jgi:hypothetical protein